MTVHTDDSQKRLWRSAAGAEYYVFLDERETSSPIVWFVNVQDPSQQAVRRVLAGTTLSGLTEDDLEQLLHSAPLRL